MLEIVEHQQAVAAANRASQHLEQRAAADLLNAQCSRDGPRHQGSVRDGSQRDVIDAVVKVGEERAGQVDRQRCLSSPAWSGQ